MSHFAQPCLFQRHQRNCGLFGSSLSLLSKRVEHCAGALHASSRLLTLPHAAVEQTCEFRDRVDEAAAWDKRRQPLTQRLLAQHACLDHVTVLSSADNHTLRCVA